MESSGVYWKPVWNILEGQFTVVLVNAQHIKNVPGRKTDQKDAEWIAQLLQHGLLRPSYVPCEIIRDLRDLTRMRTSLSQEASRISSRVQKVLEDANVKLASVATNTLGKSGRAMLEEIIAGQDDPEYLASLALGHLRAKTPQLRLALEGKIRAHHRFLLRRLLDQLRFVEHEIVLLEERLEDNKPNHSVWAQPSANCLENFIRRRTAKRLSCGFARFNHPTHAQRPHNFKRTELCARRDAHFLSSSEAQFRTTFTCIALVSLSGSLMQMKCCPSGITP